jgi:hypothetical protein
MALGAVESPTISASTSSSRRGETAYDAGERMRRALGVS